MKKQKQKQETHELDEFENHCHLWNIVPGGSGKGIVLLRKVVDAIQNDNYSASGNKLPSFLITGASGKKLVAKAIANSLAIEDIRTCPSKYFENGIFSYQFFWDSIANTAHIITDIEELNERAEATLWKFLKKRECIYYNHTKRSFDIVIYCNGLIIMTCNNIALIPDTIIKVTDHIIKLEPYTLDQLEAVVHQKLVFCNLDYDGDEILRTIIDIGNAKIDLIMQFLKTCILILKAELKDCLDMEIVNRAKWLWQAPVPPPPVKNDMPF